MSFNSLWLSTRVCLIATCVVYYGFQQTLVILRQSPQPNARERERSIILMEHSTLALLIQFNDIHTFDDPSCDITHKSEPEHDISSSNGPFKCLAQRIGCMFVSLSLSFSLSLCKTSPRHSAPSWNSSTHLFSNWRVCLRRESETYASPSPLRTENCSLIFRFYVSFICSLSLQPNRIDWHPSPEV